MNLPLTKTAKEPGEEGSASAARLRKLARGTALGPIYGFIAGAKELKMGEMASRLAPPEEGK